MAKSKDAEKRQGSGEKAAGAHSGNSEAPRQRLERSQAEETLRETAGARGSEQEAAHRVELSRRDIIFFEQRLKTAIQSLFPFKGHSIHFPRTTEERPADWRRDEDRLLLPLPSPKRPVTASNTAEEPEAPMGNGMAQASAAAKVSSGHTLPSGFSRGGGSFQTTPRKEGQSPLIVHGRPRAAQRGPESAPSLVFSGTRTQSKGPEATTDDSVLGVFVARGVEASRVEALLPFWPEVGRLITDNLLQYKRSICDPVTGLFSRHYLLECLTREIEALRYSLPLPAGSRDGDGPDLPPGGTRQEKALRAGTRSVFHPGGEGLFSRGAENSRRVSVGVLVVRFAALRDVVREFGYQFADELMIAQAEALAPLCPEQALAARTGDFEFALCLPAATPKECNKLAVGIAAAMRRVSLVHPLRHERVGINASVGFILYPQDMAGEIFLRPPAEQARLTLRKARLAAALADDERPLLSSRQGTEPVLAFSRILAEGGRVLEVLPLSRVMVSLGANMHAREGQRFSVWSIQYPVRAMGAAEANGQYMAPLYKGELVLMEIRENASQAEIISLGEPSWTIEPGDRLVLLPEEQGSAPRSADGEERRDPDTGLLRHGDFFARWVEERESCDSFAMALLRIGGPLQADRDPAQAEMRRDDAAEDGSTAFEDDNETPFDESGTYPRQIMSRVAAVCREALGQKTLGGRFGLNSLIFFHPGMEEGEAIALYEKLAAVLEESLGLDVAVGLACHPCLNFRKADAPENCRKALEYAMLLPRPHVGALDSLALNISADKFFSQGDSFGAIKEYQQALLADENNGMAWNSLGICLAGLGRHAEAERNFATALASDPDDVMAMYNLGYMHQSQGRDAEAEARYNGCLAREPEHLFSLMRLGQLAENKKDNTAARALYEKAAALPGGESLTRRHFARLCLSEGKQDEAREHLHEALLYDPQDAVSLQLLARLYLDAGEDPDLAAGLARQSVSLRPGLKAGWLELARALEAMGRDQQAREARLRSGEA